MTTYTFSFYAKVGERWTYFSRTTDSRPKEVDFPEMARQMVAGFNVSVIAKYTLQLEEGAPASGYTHHAPKKRNTNAWKPVTRSTNQRRNK